MKTNDSFEECNSLYTRRNLSDIISLSIWCLFFTLLFRAKFGKNSICRDKIETTQFEIIVNRWQSQRVTSVDFKLGEELIRGKLL